MTIIRYGETTSHHQPPSPLGLPQSGQDDLLGQLWSAVEGRPWPPLEAVRGDGGEAAVFWGRPRHVPSLQKFPPTELHKVNYNSDCSCSSAFCIIWSFTIYTYRRHPETALGLPGPLQGVNTGAMFPLSKYQASLIPSSNQPTQVWPCSIWQDWELTKNFAQCWNQHRWPMPL